MYKCTNCGAEVLEGAKFCAECGTEVPQQTNELHCQKCGNIISHSDAFCANCGANIQPFKYPASGQR